MRELFINLLLTDKLIYYSTNHALELIYFDSYTKKMAKK